MSQAKYRIYWKSYYPKRITEEYIKANNPCHALLLIRDKFIAEHSDDIYRTCIFNLQVIKNGYWADWTSENGLDITTLAEELELFT
ncbi:MAG: hypothetical protein K9W46_04385 [Candidatus Heimdallarchaeum endolithica]|uniref:Uncharacterized protein n=1 Tax=Candidatus Heimdallarchaeum endolithica TaxID=2876572 RepID=A0A9Y1BSI1_9ARCH|nr:MAG: hypothetical protein K9W46_04385 [Candidatus Heimdallarchaeum endolithica]